MLVFSAQVHCWLWARRAVTTYHYDNYRTGWNQNESSLTPANVCPDNVRSAANRGTRRPGGRAATGGAGRADHRRKLSGHARCGLCGDGKQHRCTPSTFTPATVLLSPNFGTPVSQQSAPGKCNDNGPNVGINSTPVIDPSSNTLYVMVYTQGQSGHSLHAARPRSGKFDR